MKGPEPPKQSRVTTDFAYWCALYEKAFQQFASGAIRAYMDMKSQQDTPLIAGDK